MLSSCSDTLLTVDSSSELAQVGLGIGGPEEDRLILVHTLQAKSARPVWLKVDQPQLLTHLWRFNSHRQT
jgi:hypothetical protein